MTDSGWHVRVASRRGGFRLDVDISGGPGTTAIVGENGSGKTTLLRAIVGSLAPDECERCEVRVGERTLVSLREHTFVPVEGRRVGYLPQGYALFPHLDVLDNLAFGLALGPRRLTRAARRDKAHELLAALGLASLETRGVHALSGGEAQRVALARALMVEPDLLLLDEPLAALDAMSRRRVRRFLVDRLADYGRPSVLVTHDVRDVAALDAAVVVLEAGRVVQTGSLAALRQSPATDFVAEFVNADSHGLESRS